MRIDAFCVPFYLLDDVELTTRAYFTIFQAALDTSRYPNLQYALMVFADGYPSSRKACTIAASGGL